MTTIDDTLAERGARYGDFSDHASVAQNLQDSLRAAPGWRNLNVVQRQALTVIADKLARILTGDPNYADSWHDIQGYAKLVEDRLPREAALLGKSFDTVITDGLGDGWIEWHGGERPVPPETHVEVHFRNYDAAPVKQARADHWNCCWDHSTPTKFDIVAYRIVQDVPKPDTDGWIEWHGGDCPVSPETRVEIRQRDGCKAVDRATNFYWRHDGEGSDIVAYRILKD